MDEDLGHFGQHNSLVWMDSLRMEEVMFLIIYATVSSDSCPCDSSAVMEYNQELWAKINLFSAKLLCRGVFSKQQKGNQESQLTQI